MPDIPELLLLDDGLEAVELPPQAANIKAKRRPPRRLHKKRLFIYPHSFFKNLMLLASFFIVKVCRLPHF